MTETSIPEIPLLRNRDFLFFIVGRFSNVVGVQILTVAVGWYVYKLTGDPLDLGYIGLAQFIPALLFFLVAGYGHLFDDGRALLTSRERDTRVRDARE